MVAPKSAVCEDSGEAGVQVCCSWPQSGHHGHALCTYPKTRVMVVLTLFCWLLDVVREGVNEDFPSGGAQTAASMPTVRACGC